MPQWDIGGGATSTSSKRYANNTNAMQVRRLCTLGRARSRITSRRYDLRLNVFNLIDRRYFDALIPSDGGRSVPGTGRTAMRHSLILGSDAPLPC